MEAAYARARTLTVDDIGGFLAAGVPPRALTRQAHGSFLPIRRDLVAIDRDRFAFARE